ncbi:hypothetical protein QQS21_000625 [Conoideocrella luteorostrata]|uniref:Nudix hydrolase domain-containing protein n=1 Tax=Conoideocrella luteorostrata TaxID=1105319 RepID=A0AAJ0FY96_9HYPO|nr:hypothetical protein QQS21_000625 [Conoideocrella luteorostrata]
MSNLQRRFHFHNDVAEYNVCISRYLQGDSTINNVCVGAVIFGNDEGSRMLLIQRTKNDFGGLMWEVPGGACEQEQDETILHSVAREVWEETGLHVRSVRRLVDAVHFVIDTAGEQFNHRWRKLTFEVEIEEGYGSCDQGLRTSVDQSIKLDPKEHEDWGWATEKEVEDRAWEKGELGRAIRGGLHSKQH